MDTLDLIIKMFLNFCQEVANAFRLLYEYQNYVIAIIILLIILLIILRLKSHLSPIKLFDNNNGIVTLKKKALFSLVESVCYNMGSLNKPKVKINVKRKRLSIDVSLKIESDQRLVDFTSKLQEELQLAFIEQLGIEKLGKINVNINEFRGLLRKPLSSYQKNLDNEKKVEDTPSETIIDSEI